VLRRYHANSTAVVVVVKMTLSAEGVWFCVCNKGRCPQTADKPSMPLPRSSWLLWEGAAGARGRREVSGGGFGLWIQVMAGFVGLLRCGAARRGSARRANHSLTTWFRFVVGFVGSAARRAGLHPNSPLQWLPCSPRSARTAICLPSLRCCSRTHSHQAPTTALPHALLGWLRPRPPRSWTSM
jgi:hypothetical protein